MSTPLPRVLALWVPDWPVHAHRVEFPEPWGQARTDSEAPDSPDPESAHIEPAYPEPPRPEPPLALVHQHRIVACSAAARAEGVRIGIREREAQSRCPRLELHPHHPEADARRFAHITAAVEELIPGVEVLRPGLCVMHARGPARYYGDEAAAAAALIELTAELGIAEARVGVASGRFAAEQAARSSQASPAVRAPSENVRIVSANATTTFLAELPVAQAAQGDLAEVLHGLGVRTLGTLAALPEQAVRERFGPAGIAAHRLASAQSIDGNAHRSPEVSPRTLPPELTRQIDFEPPLGDTDQLAFACSSLADEFVRGLTAAGRVCTELRVELTDDTGVRHERCWAHPRHFTGTDVLNRVRWQASALPHAAEREGAGVAHLRFSPERTDQIAAHEPGLWDAGPDARVHHHLSRLQSRIGHEGVGTAELEGGRLARERQRLVPWGTKAGGAARRVTVRAQEAGAWPGHLPAPHPSHIFSTPLPAELWSARNERITVDGEDLLAATPAKLQVQGHDLSAPVLAWSPPWPIRERWWSGRPERFRMQLLLENGDAWLLLSQHDTWFAEGRYD